ncbi:MAG: site-specific integrase, partial [Mariprofundaceae bacterium]|nr:site-specific integrase [Mariprofundaceae bacterium]
MAITKYKTEDNKTRYQVRVYYKGKRYGGKSFESKQTARTWERQKLVELESKGVFTDTDEAHNTILKDMIIKYRDTVSIRKKGFSSEKGKLNNIANSDFANKPLSHIQSKHIAAYRDELLNDGYAPATVKQYLALLSNIYTKIINEWQIATVQHVVKGVKRPVVNNARERRLLGDEQERLLASADDQYDLRNAIIIALETGMRQGEIASLKWQDIDLKKRHIYVRKSKSGFTRTVRLSKVAVGVFNSMKLKNGKKVFVTKAGDISRAFTRLVRKLEI